MFYSLRKRFEQKPLLADLLFALFFGALSLGMGEWNLSIPGVEGGQTDFREIPLVISVFYIRNPLFLIIAILITTIELHLPEEGSYFTTFIMHIIPILITWYFYRKLSMISSLLLNRGLIWVFFIIVYYTLLVIPIMMISDKLLEVNPDASMKSYINIVKSIKLELVATAFITGLYLVQFETREKLMKHRKNLEIMVKSRTKELAYANNKLRSTNDELFSSSEEIKSMNENLDGLVKERSKKIEDQLELLIRYAHMNSHEVRAPLARILGLLEIIKLDPKLSDNDKIVNDLCNSGEELDEIVKSMNRLLEKEIDNDEIS